MVLRLLIAIWALVLLVLGVVFLTLGLVLGDDQRAFVVIGAAILAPGLALAVLTWLLHLRARAELRRRREGERTVAHVVHAHLHTMTRIGVLLTYTLTVRFRPAGAGETEVTRKVLVRPTQALEAGQQIEIRYDPSDPSNFEPV